MPETEFEAPLSHSRNEWLRMRFTTVRGQVVVYTAQYETTIHGARTPVMRFDNAHGFAHRDRLDRSGRVVEKRAIAGNPDPGAALTQAQQDIVANWRRYRAEFFGDDHDEPA